MALKISKAPLSAAKPELAVSAVERALQDGDLESVANHLLGALEQDGKNAALFVQLGYVLFQQEKFDKAVIALRQALELDPYNENAANTMGVVLFKLEWYAAAEIFFRRVLELDPQHASAKQSLIETMRLARDRNDQVLPELDYLVKLARPLEPRLSLCMIVKNEEPFLEGCLESVQGVVDEVVIVDTGSTDRTVEIAERFGAKVVHFAWTGDFAEARNVSLKHATGDWILVLDADERLDTATHGELKKLLRNKGAVGYALLIENRLGSESRDDSQLALIFRLFQNRPDVYYEGMIHEQASLSAQKTGLQTLVSKVKITHLGYMQTWMTERNKFERNLNLLLRQLEKEPENPYVYFNLGQTYKMDLQWDVSAQNYQRSLEILKATGAKHDIPYYANLYHSLGDVCRHLKEFDRAHAILDEGMGFFPNFPDLLYTKGLVYLSEERYEEAIAQIERCQSLKGIVHAGGTDPTITGYKGLHAIGVCYSKLGNLRKAKEYLSQALDVHPWPDAELLTNVGVLHMQDGELAEGMKRFIAALERDPGDLRAWTNLALISFRLGEYAEVIKTLDQALEIDENLPDAWVLKAEAYMRLGRPKEASEALGVELARHPESRRAWLNLGLARLQQEDMTGALEAWEKFPSDQEVRGLSALARVLLGEPLSLDRPEDGTLVSTWMAGIDHLLMASQTDPIQVVLDRLDEFAADVAGLELALGQTLHRHGIHELALNVLLRAQTRTPGASPVYSALGRVCLALGNQEDARVMFERAVMLDPTAELPRQQLERLGRPLTAHKS